MRSRDDLPEIRVDEVDAAVVHLDDEVRRVCPGERNLVFLDNVEIALSWDIDRLDLRRIRHFGVRCYSEGPRERIERGSDSNVNERLRR